MRQKGTFVEADWIEVANRFIWDRYSPIDAAWKYLTLAYASYYCLVLDRIIAIVYILHKRFCQIYIHIWEQLASLLSVCIIIF